MGLFFGLRFLIYILDLLLTIFPFHLLGLKGLTGEMASLLEFKFKIGPCTERLYAVLPAGVHTNNPSPLNFLIIFFFPFNHKMLRMLFFFVVLKTLLHTLNKLFFMTLNIYSRPAMKPEISEQTLCVPHKLLNWS